MDFDLNNVLVLAGFAAVLVAAVVAYLVAWRSKQTKSRTAGSLTTGIIMGAAGPLLFTWLTLIVAPFAPHDGLSAREWLVIFLAFLPIPAGAFYLSAKFLRRALRDWHHQLGK
jgi:hypothetical protein